MRIFAFYLLFFIVSQHTYSVLQLKACCTRIVLGSFQLLGQILTSLQNQSPARNVQKHREITDFTWYLVPVFICLRFIGFFFFLSVSNRRYYVTTTTGNIRDKKKKVRPSKFWCHTYIFTAAGFFLLAIVNLPQKIAILATLLCLK